MKGVICPLAPGDFDSLKISSLFVDKLVPANVRPLSKGYGVWPGNQDIVPHVDRLVSGGLLEFVNTADQDKIEEFGCSFNYDLLQSVRMISEQMKYGKPYRQDLWEREHVRDQCYYISEFLNFMEAGSAISLSHLPSQRHDSVNPSMKDVLEIVIEELPLPRQDVSWKDIIELKAESEFGYRLHLLKNWSESIVAANRSQTDIRDDLRTQLYEYETYMKAAGITCEITKLDLVVTVAPGVLEDLVKLKFESLFGRLLTVRRRRAQLQLEELQAPGRLLSIVPFVAGRLA